LLEDDEGFVSLVAAGMTETGDADNPSREEVLRLLQRDMNRNDPKRYEHEGLYQLPLHVDARRRRTGSQTYIRDTVNSLNSDGTPRYPLTVKTSALATKLVFEDGNADQDLRIAGVEYLQGSALYKADRRFDGTQVGIPGTAYATREVIVAGGVFNTPQILKLSGIGPREELESFDIPVKVELPAVGTNLQDNYESGVEVLASADFLNTFENCTNLAPGDPCLRQFYNVEGPYTQGAAPVGMLIRSSQSENNDTDLFFFGAGASIFSGFYPGYARAMAPANTFWWSIVKMQPKNRAGTVKLRSADPQDVPAINFNYFSQGRESELTAISEGVDVARKIFDRVDAPYSPFKETAPGTQDPQEVNNEIMNESWGHHATCSCPMGTDKSTSCVDSRFKVHGVSNLRIVDGSVFPRTPGAFPVLPTFMISEKATETILEDLKD
jgi:choline dehydrogenase